MELKYEIVGEGKQSKAGKAADGSGSEERGIKTRLLMLTLGRPAYSAILPRFNHTSRTDTRLACPLREHLHYFLLICTWFWSRHSPAIEMYRDCPDPRSTTVAVVLQARNTAIGADAKFLLRVHLRALERAKTCRTSR